ncbi:GAF domain-containing protein [Sphaerobacter sp.]|uniref:GAF domain-containing protein n=1 Tax=Sphaerobacter sp. TaxID=2099654 RepID=UPI001D7295CE|nr:GAF domain-containing protein [Sphaerobacter sp.]MBX5444145.1 GAF domain-containing protein [Sphaerobacter sp.]
MTSYKGVDRYATVRERVNDLVRSTESVQAILDGVCAILTETLPHYTWAGIYLVEGNDLVLAAWRGPAATEHVRIPIGEGICGYAAAHGESIIVPDVAQDPRYLQCFVETRAEIVVPILAGDRVLGEIDVDSNQLNAFGAGDQEFLEELADRLASTILKADRT